MIFMLVVESLTQILLKVQELGEIVGLKVSSLGSRVLILQFTDDTLVLIGGSVIEEKRLEIY